MKSWFLLPLFFSYLVFITLKDEFETEKALFSLYCSTSLVAIISLGYELTGFVTFDGRLQGFYTSPNYLAMYLAPGAILGVYFFTKTLQQNIKLSKKTFFGLSLILTILVIFYTYSYATWLALFASLLLTTYFYFPKNQFYLVLTCSCVLCLGLLASQANTQKFSTIIHFSERSSLSSRFIIWQASIKMLIENPLVGIGPGNFQTKYLILQPYFPPYLEWAVPQPHNIFLAFWLQSGLIGLFGFLFLLGFLFLQFLLEIKNKKTPLASVFFAFFVYLILHGFVDTPFWKNDLAFVFWVFVFLSLNYTIILQKNDPTK
ncbi:MAG: O-antigen ligase family protein [Candidatus Moraniibacteriota bacterium]